MSALNPSRFRLLKLEKLQKQIFNQTFNPMRLKTGAKILRQPLKGHYYKNWYYPDAVPRPRELKMLLPELNPVDPIEQKRLRRVAELRKKGKGAPKKLKAKRELNPKGKKK